MAVLDAAQDDYNLPKRLRSRMPDGCTLSHSDICRQSDEVSCSTFAVSDLLTLGSEGPVSELESKFPASLMSMTQSLSTLRAFVPASVADSKAIDEILAKRVSIPRAPTDLMRNHLRNLMAVDPNDQSLKSAFLDKSSEDFFESGFRWNDAANVYDLNCLTKPVAKFYYNTQKDIQFNPAARVQYADHLRRIFDTLLNRNERENKLSSPKVKSMPEVNPVILKILPPASSEESGGSWKVEIEFNSAR